MRFNSSNSLSVNIVHVSLFLVVCSVALAHCGIVIAVGLRLVSQEITLVLNRQRIERLCHGGVGVLEWLWHLHRSQVVLLSHRIGRPIELVESGLWRILKGVEDLHQQLRPFVLRDGLDLVPQVVNVQHSRIA